MEIVPNAELITGRCVDCGIEKPRTRDFFYGSRHGKDGMSRQCKPCQLIRQKAGAPTRRKRCDFGIKKNRLCVRCKADKPRTEEFYSKRRSQVDGLNYYCRQCVKAMVKERGDRNEALQVSGNRHNDAYLASRRAQYSNDPSIGQMQKASNVAFRQRSIDNYLKLIVDLIVGKSPSRNIECDINVPFLVQMFNSQNGRCALTGDLMTRVAGKGKVATNVSVDRINPKKGYTKDNVQLACLYANILKRDHSVSDLHDICSKILIKAGKLSRAEAA